MVREVLSSGSKPRRNGIRLKEKEARDIIHIYIYQRTTYHSSEDNPPG